MHYLVSDWVFFGIALIQTCCISCSVFGGANLRTVVVLVELEPIMLSPNLGRFAGCSSELLHARSLSSSSSVQLSWVELVEVGGFTGRGVAESSLRNCQIESETKLRRDSISRSNLLSIFSSFVYIRLNFVARLFYIALVTAGCAERAPYDLNWLDTV